MNNQSTTCPKCFNPLQDSQYARHTVEGESKEVANDNLACRNFPECTKAEKEIN